MTPVIIGGATLYQGDCRKDWRALPDAFADACLADPPYGDTSLSWDCRVDDWLPEVSRILKPSASIWVFGSMRFLAPLFAEFAAAGFKYSQDIVWEKQNGTGFHADRFRRVHEHAVLFYRGAWGDVHHDTQFTMDAAAKTVRRKTRPTHTGDIAAGNYASEDGGPRIARSVIYQSNEHGQALHPTQKPVELLLPLVRYSVPRGGILIDPFMGVASAGLAAHVEGIEYHGIELRQDYFDVSCARMAQAVETEKFLAPAALAHEQVPMFAEAP